MKRVQTSRQGAAKGSMQQAQAVPWKDYASFKKEIAPEVAAQLPRQPGADERGTLFNPSAPGRRRVVKAYRPARKKSGKA